MSIYLGLDVGTTTLTAVLLDAETGRTVAVHSAPNAAALPLNTAHGHERAELDVGVLYIAIRRALGALAAAEPVLAAAVRGIGVTGQQHGVAFLAPDGAPLRRAITWQDRRVLDEAPPADDADAETYLERFLRRAGGVDAFGRAGCIPAAGYLGPTLFWLAENGALPAPPARVCFIPDAAAAYLTGEPPVADPTDGGSSGIMDIVAREWDEALIRRLGLPLDIFPPVREPGEVVGTLRADVAEVAGLPAGVPVTVAVGDNQASFLGSVADRRSTILLNMGTGAQISAWVEGFRRVPGLDTRYFPGGGYLLVGAGLFGGRSLAYLAELFRRVNHSLFSEEEGGSAAVAQSLEPVAATGSEVTLLDRMTDLAAAVPAGSDGLVCEPSFTGSRADPTLRGSFTGMAPQNMTPGHLTRALLEGMAEGYYRFYESMLPHAGERDLLVGAGNAIRRNALLQRIIAARFGMPLAIPSDEEPTAVGAALLAAVATGELSDVETAMRLVRYERNLRE